MATMDPVNIHGRRAGRGLRPWLLLPKVLAVCCFFGGLAAAFVLTLAGSTIVDEATLAQLTGLVFQFVIIPGGAAAILFGILLTLQAPRVLLAQRWLQVKLLIVFLGIPPLHLIARLNLRALKHSSGAQWLGDRPEPAQIMLWVRWPIAAAVVVAALTILLARLKPRLGQNWARAYQRVRTSSSPPPSGNQ